MLYALILMAFMLFYVAYGPRALEGGDQYHLDQELFPRYAHSVHQ